MKYHKIFVGDTVKLCDIDYICITGINPAERGTTALRKYNKLVYNVRLMLANPFLKQYPESLTIKNTDLPKWGYCPKKSKP